MSKNIIDDFVIPKGRNSAFIVLKGQVIRVICHQGPQVPDIIFFNANDYREQFDAWWSVFLNCLEGVGSMRKLLKLYSPPPWENVMLTVLDDTTGSHTLGGHCSKRAIQLCPAFDTLDGRTCSDNFEESLAKFGLTLEDKNSQGVFNAFMNWEIDQNGGYRIIPPIAKRDDYIDFQAEMDILTAVSNCPCRNEVNDFECKDLKIQILE